MWAEEDSPFGTLPVELKWKIFGFLKFGDKKKARLVCSHWQTIIEEKLKREVLLTDKTESRILSCHRGQVESLTVRNLKRIISMSSLQDSIHGVDECVIERGNFAPNILNILQVYSNGIKRLRIHNLSLKSVYAWQLSDVLLNTKWSNLSSLSITIGEEPEADDGGRPRRRGTGGCHVHTSIQIFKSLEVTALKSLAIYLRLLDCDCEVPWNNIFDFILRNQECLRELKLGMTGKPVPDRIQGYEKFSKFKDLKLKKFAVKFDDIDEYDYIKYVRALCLQMRGLVSLEIESERQRRRQDVEYGNGTRYSSNHSESLRAINEFKVVDILDLHKITLKIFRCQFCVFDLDWLHGGNDGGLESLRTLELKTSRFLNIEMMPPLHNLRKCSFFETSGKFATDYFLQCMVDRMPNLEEVELFPQSGFNYFTVTHLQILRALRWLRKITVEHISPGDDSLKIFCHNTPGLSYQAERFGSGRAIINMRCNNLDSTELLPPQTINNTIHSAMFFRSYV